ncbi:Uncharacterized [Syntrophomonas zehnderi OL-4]|uniref:Uncharacterized n=1 Tax=Syntrophomonas zehnderi OL-4 TaxID=690567 RepID=A0A0E4C8Z3_9FIRM|nr:hypothetical protein [Syntrophomonas zehnderi]CFX78148.1 Uncharacterized [Syntrophomonas zehnderi OL-4]
MTKKGLVAPYSINQKKGNQNWEELFAKALDLHQRGITGDKKASQEAHEILLEIHKMVPKEALVEAYLGSAILLQGRYAVNPDEKLKKANEGLKIIDRAVIRDRNNIKIRILRAYICLNLPRDVFDRRKTAAEDFKYLLSRYDKDPSVFSAEFHQQLRRDLEAVQPRV